MDISGGVEARISGQRLGIAGYDVHVQITMVVRNLNSMDQDAYRLCLNERCREWFFAGIAAMENGSGAGEMGAPPAT